MRDSPHSAKLGQNQPSESSPLLAARIGPATLLSTKSRRRWHSPSCGLDHSACLERQHHELIHKLNANIKHNRRKIWRHKSENCFCLIFICETMRLKLRMWFCVSIKRLGVVLNCCTKQFTAWRLAGEAGHLANRREAWTRSIVRKTDTSKYLKHQKISEEFSSYKEKFMKANYVSEVGRGGFDAESK